MATTTINIHTGHKQLIDFDAEEKRFAMNTAKTLTVDDSGSIDIIENLIPTGLTFINADPKAGKSWMALNLAEAVATGKDFLGKKVLQRGDVSFFALESPDYKMKRRLEATGMDEDESVSETITFYYEGFPYRLDSGLIDYLTAIVNHRPATKLIVIDTLVKVLPESAPKGQNAYQVDYNNVDPLRQFGEEHGVAIVVLHHNNQRSDTLSNLHRANGSNGYPAASNAFYMLDVNQDKEGVLNCDGARDTYSDPIRIKFNPTNCHWQLSSSASKKKSRQSTAERVYLEQPFTELMMQLTAKGHGIWEGTATEILAHAADNKLDIGVKNAQALSRKLNAETANLKKIAGITVTRRKSGDKLIKIEKVD